MRASTAVLATRVLAAGNLAAGVLATGVLATRLLAAACAATGAAAPLHAEGSGGVVMMKGTCRKLTTPAADLSTACRSVPVSSSYSQEGRVGFYFGSGDSAVTFSGGAREIRVSDTMGVQTIDKVTLGSGGGSKAYVAVGSCRYMNALTPKPTVSCKAETEEGNFIASFDVIGGK